MECLVVGLQERFWTFSMLQSIFLHKYKYRLFRFDLNRNFSTFEREYSIEKVLFELLALKSR